MKKIIVLFLILSSSFCSLAQSSVSSNAKVMSIEEAHRLNGTADATINGIPYSQYKAQVQAQQAAKAAAEAKQIAAAKQEQQNMLGSASRVGNAKQNTQAVIATPQPSSIKNTSVDNKAVTPVKTITNTKE